METYIGLLGALRSQPMTKQAAAEEVVAHCPLFSTGTMRTIADDMEKVAMMDWAKLRWEKAKNGFNEFKRGAGEVWDNATGAVGTKLNQWKNDAQQWGAEQLGYEESLARLKADRQQLDRRMQTQMDAVSNGAGRAASGAMSSAWNGWNAARHTVSPASWAFSYFDRGNTAAEMRNIQQQNRNQGSRSNTPWTAPAERGVTGYNNWTRNEQTGTWNANVVRPAFMQPKTVTVSGS